MAVPRPANPLDVDGAMGQKTRDMIAYLAGHPTRFFEGTGLHHTNMPREPLRTWQRMINNWISVMPRWREGSTAWASVAGYVGNGGKLNPDGEWGSKTRVATAGYVLWHLGYRGDLNHNLTEYSWYGQSIESLQRALNSHANY